MRSLLRTAAVLTALALLFIGCRKAPLPTPAPTATVTPLWEGIPLDGRVAEGDVCGDRLLLSLWNAGLDTVSGDITLYSLADNTACGTLALSDGAWEVGCLSDGLFTVSLANGTVTLYDSSCNIRFSVQLHRALSFADVTPDGEWMLYGDATTAEVVLYHLTNHTARTIVSYAGHIDAVGKRDGAFYLCSGAGELLRVDPHRLYTEAQVIDIHLHRFSPYYCVGTDEGTWHAVLSDTPDSTLTLAAAGTDENLLTTGKSGWITTEKAGDTTTVRLYRPYAETLATAEVTGEVLQAACTDDGAVLFTKRPDGTLSVEHLTAIDGVMPPVHTAQTHTARMLDVPILPQMPNYPTGCEPVSTVMALQYIGETVTVDAFIDNCLPQSNDFVQADGHYRGPDPYKVFVGDPRTTASYGCMAPVIEHAVDTYFGDDTHTVTATGQTLLALCEQYIANDTPVLVWVTISMREVVYQSSWLLENGTLFNWPGNEHCMVLVGFDEHNFYFNDPYLGIRVAYDRELAQSRYEALGCQAIAIL